MNIFYYIAAAYQALGTIVVICSVGKRREPISGPAAAIVALISVGLIYLLLKAAS